MFPQMWVARAGDDEGGASCVRRAARTATVTNIIHRLMDHPSVGRVNRFGCSAISLAGQCCEATTEGKIEHAQPVIVKSRASNPRRYLH